MPHSLQNPVYSRDIPSASCFVVKRLEFTREELDSCGWTIVYE